MFYSQEYLHDTLLCHHGKLGAISRVSTELFFGTLKQPTAIPSETLRCPLRDCRAIPGTRAILLEYQKAIYAAHQGKLTTDEI